MMEQGDWYSQLVDIKEGNGALVQRFLIHPKALGKRSLLDNTVVLLFQLSDSVLESNRK